MYFFYNLLVSKKKIVHFLCMYFYRNYSNIPNVIKVLLIDTLVTSSFSGPPSVIQQGPVTALVGHDITLHCDVEGDPKPTTTWIAPVGTCISRSTRTCSV